MTDPALWLRAWLSAWIFWTGAASGSVALLLLHHLTGGGWGEILRRPLERSAAMLPLLGIASLPVILGAERIYGAEIHPLLFALRIAAYFGVWCALAVLQRRAPRWSGPGLIVLFAISTAAWWDTVVRVDPSFRSSVIALLLIVSNASAAVAIALLFNRAVPASSRAGAGALLATVSLLWGYLAFAQYLVVWSGNLPGEISWYLPRTENGWRPFALALLTMQIAVPLVLLATRFGRRNRFVVSIAAISVVAAQMIYSILLVEPSSSAHPSGEHVAHAIMLLALGGLGRVVRWQAPPGIGR